MQQPAISLEALNRGRMWNGKMRMVTLVLSEYADPYVLQERADEAEEHIVVAARSANQSRGGSDKRRWGNVDAVMIIV